jgi:hypothetical protein
MEQGTDQEDYPGNYADPVQLPQRSPNNITGQMCVGEYVWNCERRWRKDECEKDQPADPDDER